MTAHRSYGIFWGQEKSKKIKKPGYYETEHIDNPCISTLAVNPKEYLELFEDKNINKKHKGIKKGSSGLGFKNFAQRIGSLVNFDTSEKPPRDTKNVSRFNVLAGEMVKSAYVKNKFSQINDKRFYFPDGVVSSPFYHPVLSKIDKFKQKKIKKLKYIFGKRRSTCFV